MTDPGRRPTPAPRRAAPTGRPAAPTGAGAAAPAPSPLPLDSRQSGIARLLLEEDGSVSVEHVATELRLTRRIVRYNVPSVEAYVRAFGLRLVRRRGVGLWVDGPAAARRTALAGLDRAPGPAVLDASERRARILLALLDAAPGAVRSGSLETELLVSRPTIRRDVREAEGWLEGHRLHLRRIPGVGLAVAGGEVDLRAALVALVLETVSPRRLVAEATQGSAAGTGGNAGGNGGNGGTGATDDPAATFADFVGDLDLALYRSILAGELQDYDERDPTMLTAALYLAVVARRVRAGNPVRLAPGRFRSLMDHPVSDAAGRIAADIGRIAGVDLEPADVAAITESLLGFVELSDDRGVPAADELRYIDRLIAAAARLVHPSLAEDEQLRSSLAEHVRRLHVRMRYQLPVGNPLEDEVRRRYPDVYGSAAAILEEIGGLAGGTVPAEEVGFLTMYLAGSLERHRLRPKVRVTVVCPAGMATAWILVSRLLAEFPQLEIVRVVSKTAFEAEADGADGDLVVSTIALDDVPHAVPSLVVSPLLREVDVRRLGRILGGLGG